MMGSRFIVVAAILLVAHASPLAADEPSVPVRVGPAVISAPESWFTLAGFQQLSGPVLDLTPPLSQVDGYVGIDTEGVLKVDIQIRYDHFGIEDDWNVTGALENTKESLGIARPEDAAAAFEAMPFDALYGGVTTNFGKSGITALYLLGSVPMEEYGTVAVGAVIPQAADALERYYTIAFPFDLGGEPFVARITLKATRRFDPSDLGWVDLAVAIANNRYNFDN